MIKDWSGKGSCGERETGRWEKPNGEMALEGGSAGLSCEAMYLVETQMLYVQRMTTICCKTLFCWRLHEWPPSKEWLTLVLSDLRVK